MRAEAAKEGYQQQRQRKSKKEYQNRKRERGREREQEKREERKEREREGRERELRHSGIQTFSLWFLFKGFSEPPFFCFALSFSLGLLKETLLVDDYVPRIQLAGCCSHPNAVL